MDLIPQLRAFLSGQIDRLQASYPPNRVVALLLVVLGAPAAALGGFLAVWVPKHFPGLPNFTAGQYTGFFLSGFGVVALAAVTMAYRFIDGVQRDEAHVTGLADAAASRDHVEHLEAMRLESAERVALVEKAHDADHAAELLGVTTPTAVSTPAEAVGDTLPPLSSDPVPPAPVYPQTAQEGSVPAIVPPLTEGASVPEGTAVPPPDQV